MTMMQENFTLKHLKQLICDLSNLVGIIPFYYDSKGNRVEISFDTKAKIISAMGFPLEEESIQYWIEYFKNYPAPDFIEPVYVIEQNDSIEIYLKKLQRVYIEIFPFEELGQKGDAFHIQVEPVHISENKYRIDIPPLSIGYYKLRIFLEKAFGESILIIVPKECFHPYKNKTWGIHLNLWSLRGNSVEGNFSHLKEIARIINSLGGFISINPLHYNDPEDIYGISPYSALSREFKTPLYLSKGAVKEKNERFFDYFRIWKEKKKSLRQDFERFYIDYTNGRAKEFINYKESLCPVIREDLKYFSVFCFLREKIGKDWQSWEPDIRYPTKEFLNKIYCENEKEVLFYEYLQWLIENEINEIREYSVLLDLGFGSIALSFDVWIQQDLYALSAEYGATPDDFNPKGQKWGFSPVIPYKLKKQAYISFIKFLKSNMMGKFLRIDHALGFFRAFWIPEGSSPYEGAYVQYPWKDLLGIIALESQLNKVAVIGEDLGIAEEWMRKELIKRKISSWKVFYFEKHNEKFKPSRDYPEESLCSITTHDLPTFKGYWNGKDIKMRKKFNIFDESAYKKALQEREKDKENIILLLKEEGYLTEEKNEFEIEEILIALIKFLSATSSRYILLYPEDLLLMDEQTNLPGTTTEYPNWQIKLSKGLDEIIESPIFKKIESFLRYRVFLS